MSAGPSLAELRRGFAAPPADARPMMRWWWFGPAVEEAELDRELRAMAAAGIGGVEVSYVYPLVSDSPDLLSPQFCDRLRYAAERARDLGLRFDLTLGSGWSFGGPHIGTDLAAKMISWERREIDGTAFEVSTATHWPGDQLIAAFIGGGSVQEPPQDCTPLEIGDGVLNVPAGSGPRQLLLAWARPTGQVVKRAAAGADGPVLDHFSAAAAQAHIAAVAEPLLQAVGADLVGSVFCDSLEVYQGNWTPEIVTEFERRRGYPLLPRLHQLIIDADGSDRLRIDYYRTLTELYEENFVAVFQSWASGHGVPFRIQGYGTPPAKISSYRFADLYEGEGWGWKEITQSRWASSAAHLDGLPVVSSETWTWVHSPSFRATPLDLKGEAHEHLLIGINQFIGHGWPYSPSGDDRDPDGLGWYFYAAGALDDRNPWWPAMPALSAYLQRLCWLARQGNPVADVLIYVPADDIYPHLGHEAGGTLDLWRETARRIDPAIPAVVRENGWDFDLVDDETLDGVEPGRRPVIILPQVDRLPDQTRTRLDDYRRAGGTVITIGGTGYPDGTPAGVDNLREVIAAVIAPDLAVSPSTGDIGAIHRRWDGIDVYVVINTGPHAREVTLTPRAEHDHYELWDPDTTAVTAVADGAEVSVVLEPYQAAVLVGHDQQSQSPEPGTFNRLRQPADRSVAQPAALQLTDWTVSFGSEPPAPVTLPHRWEDDPQRTGFSGTVSYRAVADLDADPTADGRGAVLDFGPSQPDEAAELAEDGIRGNSYRIRLSAPVREVVEVIINGEPCGVVWAPPYAIEIGDRLRAGRNEIELRVSNTAANALSRDTAIGRAVAASRQRYGWRFHMQDLDRAMDGVSSGLLHTPTIRLG